MNDVTHALSQDGLTLTTTGYTLQNKEMTVETSWKTQEEVERNLEHAKVYNKIHIITQGGYSKEEIIKNQKRRKKEGKRIS